MRQRRAVVFGPLLLSATAGLGRVPHATAQPLAPTPACGDHGGSSTTAQTEGPYFKPRSPERNSLLGPGLPGPRMVLVGRVLATNCQPIAGALLDFWHADGTGAYDNSAYRCRGHQFTDGDGRYHPATVVPGSYPGRTRHIHVKLQPQGGALLTTQLYFPGERQNRADPLFRWDLEMAVATDPADGSRIARFEFVRPSHSLKGTPPSAREWGLP